MSNQYSSAVKSVDSFIVEKILSASDPSNIFVTSAEGIGEVLGVDRCVILPPLDAQGEPTTTIVPVEWTKRDAEPRTDAFSLSLARFIQRRIQALDRPLLVASAAANPLFDALRVELRELRVKSVLALNARHENTSARGIPDPDSGVNAELDSENNTEDNLATIIVYQCDDERDWTSADVRVVTQLARVTANALHKADRIQNLSQSETHYRALAQRGLTGLVEYDCDGKVVSINSAFEALTGITTEYLQLKSYAEVLETVVFVPDRERVLQQYHTAVRERRSVTDLEYRIINASTGQSAWVVDHFGPIQNRQGLVIGFESLLSNITDKRRAQEQLAETEGRYQRLVEHSDALIFHTDADHCLTYMSRRATDFLGLVPEEFGPGSGIPWYEMIFAEDRERIMAVFNEMAARGASFDEEFRVENRITKRVRWLLVRMTPVRKDGRNTAREIDGWDGFGVDISERREAQEALEIQSRKIRALYTVSSAIRGYWELGSISQRGVDALCDATGAAAGMCYLYSPDDGDLQLVAEHSRFIRSASSSERETDYVAASARLGDISQLQALARYVASHRQPVVIPDMGQDPRATKEFVHATNLHSAVFVPIAAEDETLGALALLSPELERFDGGDVMLVSAAANQIGLAARQANLFTAYRRQAKNLSALYRISHELAQGLSLDDVFQRAFSIVRDELGLKRLWLGLLDDTGTRIVGQAAYGPGFKRRLVEVNVQIRGRGHPIARVVTGRQPLVIDNPEDVLREMGLRRIFSRLEIQSMALVPLISSGRVVGVLAVQPRSDELALDAEELGLLSSLANEIAVVLLAKRLEDRIQESERMRTAGMLAAGIAHNFNNLLQAILGQASLLEIQAKNDTRVSKAVKVINEAAGKGAGLVKQLLGFAHMEHPHREECDVNAVIERGADAMRRMLLSTQELVLRLDDQLPRVLVDPGQLLKVVLSLVSNASESMERTGTVEIWTDSIDVLPESNVQDIPDGRYVRVNVRDNGRGMDEQTRRRCFEPFFTTKNVDPSSGLGMSGSGLGLAAAYALIRQNGGRMTVESRIGVGSLFTIVVPIVAEEEDMLVPQEIHIPEKGKNGHGQEPETQMQESIISDAFFHENN